MQKTYLFYDLETSGLNKSFDQVLQFAAIRTDMEFNEIERHELLVKLNPDVIPSPKATITHRISPTQTSSGVSEIEAIKFIHKLMNTPGTISLGYNTLGFDDEFLRFSFYRNLLPPYTHQYANGCSRMDLYPITAMYYLYKKSLLNWPVINNKISLKLEQLNTANQLAAGMAHNAMVDVEATLALARILSKERDMWQYLCGAFDKATDLTRAAKLKIYLQSKQEQHRLAILVDGTFGADAAFHSLVLSLGQHNHYKNQSLWLRLDRPELITTTPETIANTTWVMRKKAGESGLLLPIEDRFLTHIDATRLQLIESNKKWLSENLELLNHITEYHKEFIYTKVPNRDVDAALYDSAFWTDDEHRLCQLFHGAELNKKHLIADQFTNANLKEMAIRIIGRNYPQYLSAAQNEVFADYMQSVKSNSSNEILVDYRGDKRMTPHFALAEIQALLTNLELAAEQKQLLQDLQIYITNNFATIEAIHDY